MVSASMASALLLRSNLEQVANNNSIQNQPNAIPPRPQKHR
jgi:hypothetical protein